jgi:hypothetical protein
MAVDDLFCVFSVYIIVFGRVGDFGWWGGWWWMV